MKPIEGEAHCNPSANDEFGAILEAALSRRSMLKGGLGLAAIGFLAGPRELMAQSALIGFGSVPLTGEDRVIVANGYRAEVLYAWGDPISNGPAWDPNVANSAEEQAVQAGMHHDGMHFFPFPLGSNSSTRGLLAINHEYTDEGLLHRTAQNPWTPDKVLKSQAAHGVSIIEVALEGDRWRVVRPSSFARRITAFTPIAISGRAAGDEAMRTSADPNGTRVLGTINNCAHGYTPWGTYLTCEENFNGYFVNRGTITPLQSRYGISATPAGYRWYEHDGRGVLWIQTDISSGSLGTGDHVNIPTNMMLAADPASGQTRRFLTGPRGCEITGIAAPPDLRTMFINVQHPGEGSAEFNNPNNPAAVSSWPDGPGINRPRSATVVIRKQDGGVIGT